MSWVGAVRTASGGMLRHKVQAVAIGLVVLVSTASATLGLTLLAASNGPFRVAFGAQHERRIALELQLRERLAAVRDERGGVTQLELEQWDAEGRAHRGA